MASINKQGLFFLFSLSSLYLPLMSSVTQQRTHRSRYTNATTIIRGGKKTCTNVQKRATFCTSIGDPNGLAAVRTVFRLRGDKDVEKRWSVKKNWRIHLQWLFECWTGPWPAEEACDAAVVCDAVDMGGCSGSTSSSRAGSEPRVWVAAPARRLPTESHPRLIVSSPSSRMTTRDTHDRYANTKTPFSPLSFLQAQQYYRTNPDQTPIISSSFLFF